MAIAHATPLALFPVLALSLHSFAADAITGEPKTGSNVVELFSAMNEEVITVKVVPRDASRLTLQIQNNSDQPLAVSLPIGFVAAPVLAQIGPFNQQQNAQGGNQAVGGQFGRNNGVNFGNQNQQNNFQAFFNVPPGKIIKKRIETVCLEYGKPNPKPQIQYEIRRVEDFTDSPAISELLAEFARGKVSQRVTQIAAWHLANDMSWNTLAELKRTHLNGKHHRLYSLDEIRQARELIRSLPSEQSDQHSGYFTTAP